MTNFDVAILGGGPAACSAALSLSKRGVRIGIFAGPDAKQRPTETASPALRRILVSLGAQQAFGLGAGFSQFLCRHGICDDTRSGAKLESRTMRGDGSDQDVEVARAVAVQVAESKAVAAGVEST